MVAAVTDATFTEETKEKLWWIKFQVACELNRKK